MIIIDGRASDLRIENFANLEEILVEANTECTREQRIVTDVLLNSEPFSEIYPHQAEDIERDEIRSVEISTMPLGEMALNCSRSHASWRTAAPDAPVSSGRGTISRGWSFFRIFWTSPAISCPWWAYCAMTSFP